MPDISLLPHILTRSAHWLIILLKTSGQGEFIRLKRKRKTKKEKKEIFIPNFTLILTVIFLLLSAIGMSQYKNTIKYCTEKATGIVTCRGFGRKDIGGNHNLSTGKKYAEILLYDDSKLAGKHIYAPVYVGDKGDEVSIHYNADNPDEYYIDAVADYYKQGSVLVCSFGAFFFAASVFFAIYYNLPRKPQNDERKGKSKK